MNKDEAVVVEQIEGVDNASSDSSSGAPIVIEDQMNDYDQI